jgi:hypothetical protein
MALPRLPRNIPLRDVVRAVTSSRRALPQLAMYSAPSTRSAASSGRFPPAVRRSFPPHALIPLSRRSALRAKVLASVRAFAAAPAPLLSTGSVCGFAGSAAPTVSVSCCGCVPAIARPSPLAALLPAPLPVSRFVFSLGSRRNRLISFYFFSAANPSQFTCPSCSTLPVTRSARVSNTSPPYFS